MKLPNKKYDVIYADPPWNYNSKELYGDKVKGEEKRKNRFRKLERKYSTMKIKELKELNINKIAKENCLLFMWVTDSHIPKGIEIMESWGFKYKTVAFNWIKLSNKGNTYYNYAPTTLKSWELCLVGGKGKTSEVMEETNIKGLVKAERTVHSKKPNEVRRRIEQLVEGRNNLFDNYKKDKIELFAREKTDGWDVWGNETDKFSKEE